MSEVTPRPAPRRPPGWVIVALSLAAAVAVVSWTIIAVSAFSVLHEMTAIEIAVMSCAADPTCELVPPPAGTPGG